MASKYGDLLDQGNLQFETPKPKKKSPSKEKKPDVRGCATCPLNKDDCIKIIGLSRVTGREIFVWAQSPGYKETRYQYVDASGVKRVGMELVGPSGDFLWKEMAAVGIKREDCDIQNVVRCRPTVFVAEKNRDFDRPPSKEEIKHCSIYTERAIEKNDGKAKVHIVLGLVTAKALLGKEFKKDHTIFWSERLNAKVICIAHPAYFLREGYKKSKLQEFRAGLRAAVETVKGKATRFAFLDTLDIKQLETPEDFAQEAEWIEKAGIGGIRTATDIEDGPRDNDVGRALLCVGFCYAPKRARVVYIDKTDVPIDAWERSRFLEILEKLYTNPKIPWIAQHGMHEVKEMRKIHDIKIANLDYDTEYAEYITYSNRGSYSLDAIAEARFPEYAGYKEMVKPYLGDAEGYNPVLDFDKIPHHIMTPYNGTDCILTKDIERTTKKHVPLPLLHAMMDAAWVYDAMNQTGPLLDLKHYDKVKAVLPDKVKRLKHQLALIAGDPDFNPGSNGPNGDVYKLLYKTLKLEKVIGKKNKVTTDKNALRYLKQFHEAPGMIDEYRHLTKMISTYLETYYNSAQLFDGEVHTIWHVTGTGTGRRRSGKKKKEKSLNKGITNLQNVHGDRMLQNLLVSDTHWRRIYKQEEYKEIYLDAYEKAMEKLEAKK